MFFHLRQHPGVLDQLAPGHLGDDLSGQIVLGRADAAAGNDDIGALQRARDDFFHPRRVVADDRFEIEIHAERSQPLRHPRRIGVDDLSQQQLRPNRNDFRSGHKISPRQSQIYTLARARDTRPAERPNRSLVRFPASLPQYAA